MKKKIAVLLLIIAALAPVSCKRHKTIMDAVRYEGLATFDESLDSVGLTYEIDVDYLVSSKYGDEVRDAINEVISGLVFGPDFETPDVRAAAEDYVASLREGYRIDASEMYENMKEYISDDPDAEMPLYALMWEENLYGEFIAGRDGLDNYVVSNYQFLGGAHGGTSITPFVYEAATGKIVPENEFFVEGYEEPVADLIFQDLEEQYGDDLENVLFEDAAVRPNGDYQIDAEGVTWYFQEYEIAAYASGIIIATVPWDKLKPYVRPGMVKLD